MALDVGPGDEVITSPLTFIATAEVILRLGAKPVFADVCPNCLCINPSAAANAVTERTRALIAVDLFGQLGHIHELAALARDCRIDLVEDACQAFGSKLDGHHAGSFGRAGCFSFFPSKPLGGFGDAGMVVTNDPRLADRLRSLRSHGRASKHQFVQLGGNFRIDTLQAALLNVLLPHIEHWVTTRRRKAHIYTQALRCTDGLLTPRSCNATQSAWGAYTIRVADHRDALARQLADEGIETAIYYPLTLAAQPLFQGRVSTPARLWHATQAARQVLSLPIFPGLSTTDQNYVTSSISRFFSSRKVLQPSRIRDHVHR